MVFSYSPAGFSMTKGRQALFSVKMLFVCLLVFFWLFQGAALAQSSVKDLYMAGDKKYQELQKNSQKQKLRSNWKDVASAFERAHAKDPKDAWAAAALYRAAETHLKLSKVSGWKSDRTKAISLFQEVERSYPNSYYKIQASDRLKELNVAAKGSSTTTAAAKPAAAKPAAAKTPAVKSPATTKPAQGTKSTVTESTIQESAPKPGKAAPPASSKTSTIKSLRHKSHPGHTRVVVDTDFESFYTYNDLKHDKAAGLPRRIYIDFQNAKLAPSVRNLEVGDARIKQIRIAQNTPDKVRLVMDIEKTEEFNIFKLYDPNRIVIDVMSTVSESETKALAASLPSTVRESTVQETAQQQKPQTPAEPSGIPVKKRKSGPSDAPHYKAEIRTPSAGAIRKQLALGVNRIVIDPGHGGNDPGALGFRKGVREKDVNLQLAKKLAEKLRARLKCEVILTRDRDVFITLEKRTQIANSRKADLFISIHTNSSPSNKAYGIETYFLNLATDDEAIAVAARENATSTKNISDLQTILNDLMQNAKINESSKLASYVQRGMITTLKPKYSSLRDKGVKQAPFYVLLGARMPSILIETGFINNQMECQRLTNAQYQNHITDGIAKGIEAYIKDHQLK